MDDFPAQSFYWLFALSFGAIFLANRVLSHKRREQLELYCKFRGWTYVTEDESLTTRWVGHPFGKGDFRTASHVIQGVEKGRRFTAFDYGHGYGTEEEHGYGAEEAGPKPDLAVMHHYTVCVIGLPHALPGLEVVPAGLLTQLSTAVGLASDVEVASEDFNRTFAVRAEDPKFASEVLSSEVIDHLLTNPDAAFRIEGNEMLGWSSGSLSLDYVFETVELLDKVVNGIPSSVWDEYALGPGY